MMCDCKLRFEPFTPALEPRPDWWKVRPQEIINICRSVKRGRAEIIAETPAGLPVYAVFYGDFSEPAPQTNWSAGSSSTTYTSYDPREADAPQTFLFLAGIHGAEAESVAAAVNLIRMLETGTDFRGKTDEKLPDLISRYRFIVIPCANMDGRAVSPDHLRNADKQTFLVASQGTWQNGDVIGWRGSKEYFPLPLEKVSFPGGYPNSAGFNIMHDACPGNIRTAEARGILQLCERWRVDAVLNGHSCEYPPCFIPPTKLLYPAHQERAAEITAEYAKRLFERKFIAAPPEAPAVPRGATFNLNNLMMLASGALPITLECCVSGNYTFEELMEPNYVALEVFLENGLQKPFCNRAEIFKG